MATHCQKSEGNGEKLREEHELVVHDGGREDGHNDDAINDSGGSGNMVVMGETLEKPSLDTKPSYVQRERVLY